MWYWRWALVVVLLLLAFSYAIAAAEAEPRPVTGPVAAADGSPLEGADVWLTSSELNQSVVIYGHAKSDHQGQFQLTVPEKWLGWNLSMRQELGLVAYRQGMGLAVLGFNRNSLPPPSGLRLVLGTSEPPQKASIQVLGPDGKPATGVKVAVISLLADAIETGLSEEEARNGAEVSKKTFKAYPWGAGIGQMHVPMPEELSQRLAATTDAAGNAVFQGIAFGQIGGISVTSDTYGQQKFAVNVWQQDALREFPKSVKLQPVGSLSGRLVAENREVLGGIPVRVFIVRTGKPSPMSENGEAEVMTDADGRFRVPAICVGMVSLRITFAKGFPLRAQIPAPMPEIKAGQQTEITIPLKRAIPAKGVVRERATTKPIAGMTLLVHMGNNSVFEELQTDATGQYECLVLPGAVFRFPCVPLSFLEPLEEERRPMLLVSVPEGVKQYEFPPLELVRGAAVHGVVLGEDHQPVANATVRALQFARDRLSGYSRVNETLATSDPKGQFSLEGLAPGEEIRLEARSQDAAGTTTLRQEAKEPVTLQLLRSELVALRGRVQDAQGKPVPGANVEIWVRPWGPPRMPGRPRLQEFNGRSQITTDAKGKFLTPRELLRDGEYRAVIRGDGFEATPTEWLSPARAKTEAFADVCVTRRHSIAGRVVDRQGKPVSGARVFTPRSGSKPLEATSDGEGKFRLDGILEEKTFVFVEKQGFRFLGEVVIGTTEQMDLALPRRDEAPRRVLKSLPMPVARPERLALARAVLEPAVKEALASKEPDVKVRSLQVLARLDPDRALGLLDGKTIEDAFVNAMLRRIVALRHAKENFDEARSVVESIANTDFRAMIYPDLCDATTDSARKLDLLGQTIVQARAVKAPEFRLNCLKQIARQLLDLGRTDQAVKILREGEAIAKQLPTAAFAGYARGAFAEELARIDLPAALALVKDLKDEREYNRHHGNIAHKLAAKDPAAAERVLNMIRETANWKWDRDQYAVRVCYRMAPVDTPRAKQLAAGLQEPYLKAQAHSVMAQALAKKQPALATDLLWQALAGLEELVRSGKDKFNGFSNASCVAATLLPVAEQIDPRLVDEFLWRAVSLRQPPPEEKMDGSTVDQYSSLMAREADVHLAAMLARYDRALAEMLFTPIWKQTPNSMLDQSRSMLIVAALLKPKEAVAAIDQIAEPRQKRNARCDVARTLGLDDEDGWQRLQRKVLAMWMIDDEDLGDTD